MATIDIKLKSYDELIFEITKLNTDLYLKNKEIERLNNIIDAISNILENYGRLEYYYKYNSKYLKSEIINDLKEVIELKGETNERQDN